ncbi:nucleotidyltransferase family protein [uncultured Duncaniella sp.]|uniref:nucleotidyltransferase family protein n=1 Tax=uncultured Duncaniella sp. TaxID=2768039 RepID=UPI002674438A|nr:nucleotidyltransferase domain-containing protein [uncultured Duncaniella sp.]MCI9173113.1 nucleotidyltransferase [Muribaculaceae bacterium]
MISPDIHNLLPKIRAFLSTQPISKAWLFGSCSRGEESENSDLDLLVSYDTDKRITLFTVGRIMMKLSELAGRNVDIVDVRGLHSYARENVDHDKILIYERHA